MEENLKKKALKYDGYFIHFYFDFYFILINQKKKVNQELNKINKFILIEHVTFEFGDSPILF